MDKARLRSNASDVARRVLEKPALLREAGGFALGTVLAYAIDHASDGIQPEKAAQGETYTSPPGANIDKIKVFEFKGKNGTTTKRIERKPMFSDKVAFSRSGELLEDLQFDPTAAPRELTSYEFATSGNVLRGRIRDGIRGEIYAPGGNENAAHLVVLERARAAGGTRAPRYMIRRALRQGSGLFATQHRKAFARLLGRPKPVRLKGPAA